MFLDTQLTHVSTSIEINIGNVTFHACKMYSYHPVLKRKTFCDFGSAVALSFMEAHMMKIMLNSTVLTFGKIPVILPG